VRRENRCPTDADASDSTDHTPPSRARFVAPRIATVRGRYVRAPAGPRAGLSPPLDDQLRRQAKDLLRVAQAEDTAAIARIRVRSDELTLEAAQLALARRNIDHPTPLWRARRLTCQVSNRRRLGSPIT
jgi:hypothetical protein